MTTAPPPIDIAPGVLVGVTSLKIHATVEKLSTDTAPGYWVVIDEVPPNRRHVIHADFLKHPDAVTTAEERAARKQQQLQNKIDLANGWTVDLVARGFTTVHGAARMRSEVDPDNPQRLQEKAEAVLEPVDMSDPEQAWRDFMARLRQIT